MQLLQGGLKGNTKLAIGIDPGVNFAMTIINMDYVQVYYGKLKTDKRAGYRGINAYEYLTSGILANNQYAGFKAIVEGAAYNSQFGQVALEEVRFGFFFALHQMGFDVAIVPPATIRKAVLGSGKDIVPNYYPTMNHNAADSIGIAMYGLL